MQTQGGRAVSASEEMMLLSSAENAWEHCGVKKPVISRYRLILSSSFDLFTPKGIKSITVWLRDPPRCSEGRKKQNLYYSPHPGKIMSDKEKRKPTHCKMQFFNSNFSSKLALLGPCHSAHCSKPSHFLISCDVTMKAWLLAKRLQLYIDENPCRKELDKGKGGLQWKGRKRHGYVKEGWSHSTSSYP